MESDPKARAYYNLYKTHMGGGFPVFQGARYPQYGQGFGDVFRNILKWILPVAGQAASTFIGALASNRASGANWKDSLKSSIAPTIMSTAQSGTEQLTNALSAGNPLSAGKGRRRKKNRKSVYKGNKRKHTFTSPNFPPSKIARYNF